MKLNIKWMPRCSHVLSSSRLWDCSEFVGRQVAELETRGIRSIAIARQVDEDGRWRFLGILPFLDPPCPDAKYTIELANIFGLEVRQ